MKEILSDQIAVTHEGDIVPLHDVFPEIDSAEADQSEAWLEYMADNADRGSTSAKPEVLPSTKLSPTERIYMAYDRAGFYTHSPRELNHAIGVLESIGKPGGVGRYMNDILLHQKKSISENPEQALRVIVGEMRDFAADANASRGMLHMLQAELPEASNLSALSSSSAIKSWRDQPTTRRGLQTIVRRKQMDEVIEKGGGKSSQQVNKAYQVDDQAIDQFIKSSRTGQTARLIEKVIDEESSRAEFWKEALKSAQSHITTRRMAAVALAELDGQSL